MANVSQLAPPDRGDVLLMVGTTKGLFLFTADPRRTAWRGGGPYFPGQAVFAAAYDGRGGRQRLLAAAGSYHFGATLRASDDFGQHFSNPEEANVKFPADTGQALKNIWQIVAGPDEDQLYCGVEPAALFESRDAGVTWSLVRGLFDHPHRPLWQPGGGGLCLHTIVPGATRGGRMWIAISSAGVYRSDDGGVSWQARNVGIRAPFLPEGSQFPEFGQCVHKVARHAAAPSTLFLQHHWGVYRSDDAGDNWRDVGKDNGLPSDFGFTIAVHPHKPETVWIVPLESDEFRATPEAKLRVYRSRDGGTTGWEALAAGLPQVDAYETVLRDGLCVDALDPAGVYFGTRSGKLFASRDEGDAWSAVATGLPPITCVKVAVV